MRPSKKGSRVNNRDQVQGLADGFGKVLNRLVGNVIRYGRAGMIWMTVTVDSKGVWITLSDNGIAFDPIVAPRPNIPDSATNASIGGLGIHMVRHAVDKIACHRIGQENRLEIRIDTEA